MRRTIFLTALLFGMGALASTGHAQVKDAEKALKKEQYDAALAFLQEALQKKPDDAKALELKGRVYKAKALATSDVDEHVALLGKMIECFQQTLALEPKREKDLRNELLLVYINEFQKGIDAYNQAQSAGDNAGFVRAARYFEGSTVIMPDSTGPYVNWAFSMMNAGRDVDAIQPLEKVVERGGADAEVYTYLANLYLTNDRADAAVPLLQEAREAYPDEAAFRAQLLNAYALSGQMERALEDYQKEIRAEPDNKVYRYNYGSILLEMDRYDEAIEQLKAAVALDSAYTDAQWNLGAAYVNKAIAVNETLNERDDDLRARRDTLTAKEVSDREDEIARLTDERRALFGMAVAPLEHALDLMKAAGRDVTEICRVLFQSYVQTNQTDKAEGVQACAGM